MHRIALVKSPLNGVDLPGRCAGVSNAYKALAERVRGVRLSLSRPVLVVTCFRIAHLDLEALTVLHLEASLVLMHVVEVGLGR